MGSGRSKLYSGTAGGSQSYASLYGVVKEMHEWDKEFDSIWLESSGYLKNPSAIRIQDAVVGPSIVHAGHKANGKMPYVIDTKGDLIFGRRQNPEEALARTPHPMLIGGKNPRVKMAGMIEFRNGKIYAIDNHSGHYRPPKKSLEETERALAKLPKEVFHRKSKWRIK